MLKKLPGLLILTTIILCFYTAAAQEAGRDKYIIAADSLLDSAQYEEAIANYQAYVGSFEKVPDAEKLTIANCFSQIATCYYLMDDYTKAIEYFQKALDIQIESGKPETIASTLNNIGFIYKTLGNYDKAIGYYEQAVKIDEESGNENNIAKSFNNIGMIYRVWGKYDKAIEYFERSLRLKNKLNDQPGVSKTLNNIGLVYTDWKKYNQAIINYRESLKIEEELNNQSEIALRYNNLGNVFYFMKQYDTALIYFNKSLLIQQQIKDKDKIALNFNNIGRVYLDQKKYESARYYLSSALSIYDELGREAEKATVLANLSKISHYTGNNASALQMLDSSTMIAEKLNLMTQLQSNYKYYSELYNDLKNYQKSLDYFKKYSDLKDTVFNRQVLSQLTDFQIKYETEKKESEIELLKKNEVIQGLALKKQTILRNSMIGLSVLLLALASVIFYSLQSKKRDNKIIASAREKSDQLLLNILPSSIAQDLKETGKTKPQIFKSVTACFADIVDFTHKSESIDPVLLIDELNQIFTAFDNIIEKYGCERIKTIGDSYLAVSGLPEFNPRHAHQLVNCCIEMVRFLKERNTEARFKWEIRIGIHTGEVIAGVVGVKKYIYDVFGDTINTASRMESNSEPMKINISESTYNLVKEDFTTEYRGELEARGKGKLKMFFVTA